MEAMAIGMPVVSSSVSGIPELVTDGENGLLVSQRNAEELADALQKLIDDPDLREQLSRNARATVFEHFDSRSCVRTLAGFLTESDQGTPRETKERELAEEGTVV
jgi:glycosyltransferase involved in cell wall biosynthesis